LFQCFERGLISRLRLKSDATCRFIALRRLIAAEPVTDVVIEVGDVLARSATAFRTLLPFPWPVRVTVAYPGGGGGERDAFCAALLSAPVMSSATELTLNGLRRPGLVGWLAKTPFLGAVRHLDLGRNDFGCPAACDLAHNPWLAGIERLGLAQNRIGNAGARALARSPHLRGVTEIDLTGNWFGAEARSALAERFGDGLIV
jgi:hypothetical protein